MERAKQRLLAIGLNAFLVLLSGCGKPPEVNPVSPPDPPLSAPTPPVAARAQLLGYVLPSEGLLATRLTSAGCMQVLRLPSGGRSVEFSSELCPPQPELAPASSVVFSLEMAEPESQPTVRLKRAGTTVGELSRRPSEGTLETWVVRHLCQISDPVLPRNLLFQEVCAVDFETEAGPKLGRFREISLVSLEALAMRKIAENERYHDSEAQLIERAATSEASAQSIRSDRNHAFEEKTKAEEALVVAQNRVRDSMASNLTVHRSLERVKAEKELELAEKEVDFLKQAVRLSRAELRRGELIKERRDLSDRAKNRDKEFRALIEAHERQQKLIVVAPEDATGAEKESAEVKLLRAAASQNRQLILGEDKLRELDDEDKFALGESKKLTSLEQDELPAANRRVLQKREEVNRVERLPQNRDIQRSVPIEAVEGSNP